MTEEKYFGKLKCTVTNEDGDLFVKDKFKIRTEAVDKNGNRGSVIVSKTMIDDTGTHAYIEQELLKKLHS